MQFREVNSGSSEGYRNVSSPFSIQMIVIGVLVVSVLALVLFLLLRGDSDQRQIRNEVDSLVEDTCTDDSCRTVVVIDQAQLRNDVSLCRMASSEDVAECYLQYAYAEHDPSACESLSSDESEDCLSVTYSLLALRERDVSFCLQIPNAYQRSVCVRDFLPGLAVDNRCDGLGDSEGECAAMHARSLALVSQIGAEGCEPFLASAEFDPESSEIPSGETYDYALCSLLLFVADPDQDGLTIQAELDLGTDPQNPDTDGDGFDDGTEFRSGYNPLDA